MTAENIKQKIAKILEREFFVEFDEATNEQIYFALCALVSKILERKQRIWTRKHTRDQELLGESQPQEEFEENTVFNKSKKLCFLSMEFVLGRSLKNHLFNLNILKETEEALQGRDVFSVEKDAGLGSSSEGRLAACLVEGLATQNYNAQAYSVLYDYGFFKQTIQNRKQVEGIEEWQDTGSVWLSKQKERFLVRFGGKVDYHQNDGKIIPSYSDCQEVYAETYDMVLSGYKNKTAKLRLFKATSQHFDFESMCRGNYTQAFLAKNQAEILTKFRYPNDQSSEGKKLRLMQEYFLTSSALQDIVQDFLKTGEEISSLQKRVSVHMSETSLALSVAELMRILVDEQGMDWSEAFEVVQNCTSYTCHDVAKEVLEECDVWQVQQLFPRIFDIIKEIDSKNTANLMQKGVDSDCINGQKILSLNSVKLANLAVAGSHTVNGVSPAHSQKVQQSIFPSQAQISPEKFANVSSGVSVGRWLCQSNAGLFSLVEELIGTGFVKQPRKLSALLKYRKNNGVLQQLGKIKQQNKRALCDFLQKRDGAIIDPDSIFDIQAKPIHQNNRQLLNCMRVIAEIIKIRNGQPTLPKTFFVSGKAMPNNAFAKMTLELVLAISQEIDDDSTLSGKIKMVFVPDCSVTVAEHLIPAAEISQQIAQVGKEASGTNNIKFMLNGALTVGSLNGINMEIAELVGKNILLFGKDESEVKEILAKGYYPQTVVSPNPLLREILAMLNGQIGGKNFSPLVKHLEKDPCFCLLDFDSFLSANDEVLSLVQDKIMWGKASLTNIAQAGNLSSISSVEKYAQDVWKLNN